MRRLLLGSVVVSIGLFSPGVAGISTAAAAAKGKKAAAPQPATTRKMNACGCYADAQGNCFCGRKGKCSCPGECEPKGCEDKRAKEMQREVAAETKRAADADRKQQLRSIDAERKERAQERDRERERERLKDKSKDKEGSNPNP